MIFHMSDFPKRRNLFIYTNSNTQKKQQKQRHKNGIVCFLVIIICSRNASNCCNSVMVFGSQDCSFKLTLVVTLHFNARSKYLSKGVFFNCDHMHILLKLHSTTIKR